MVASASILLISFSCSNDENNLPDSTIVEQPQPFPNPDEKEKKFKAKAFREILLSIQDSPMEEQRIIIDNAFESWRGNLEQIDDVCLFGMKIN